MKNTIMHGKHEFSVQEIYKGCYSVSKYNLAQFLYRTEDEKKAMQYAKKHLKKLGKLDYSDRNGIFVVTNYQYNEKGEKVIFTPSFMENTHTKNQFTAHTYKTNKGALLRYDGDGDGYGFWYEVDCNGNKISDRLKGQIFVGLFSSLAIKKFKKPTS
jgi:hypothetical protein